MNTLIENKIKEFEERMGMNTYSMQSVLFQNPEEVAKWMSRARDYFRSSLQDIEKQTREEEAKAYAKGLAVICEKYPSLATEIKAILYDELKEKK